MTEQEAAETWCPKAEMDQPRLFETDRESVRHDRCIGRRCAWWRLDHDRNKATPNDALEAHGFCGVAGKP